MAKKTLPKLNWHGDTWANNSASKAIDRELEKIKSQLAQLAGLDEPEEVDAMIDDLAAELRHAWAIFRNVDMAASSAQVFTNLKHLSTLSSEEIAVSFDELNPATQSYIYVHYPGGGMSLEINPAVGELLIGAVKDAFARLLPPQSGRPKGTSSHSLTHLAKYLPRIYASGGKRPTRIIDCETGEPRGDYREFVKLVISVVPTELGRSTKFGIKGVDHLLQKSIEYYNQVAQDQ